MQCQHDIKYCKIIGVVDVVCHIWISVPIHLEDPVVTDTPAYAESAVR